MMRIITGSARGVRLDTLEGEMTRPTTERAKEAVFSILRARTDLSGARVLDLFAGSGALALDENRQVLAHQGFSKAVAREMIDFMQQSAFDLSWNAFSFDDWVVASRADARVQREESIVHAQAREGSVDSFAQDVVHKILCICNPACTEEIERQMKARFPSYSIVRSSPILLEIMRQGVTKASAVRTVCAHYHTTPENAYAFGDNYNDEDMLRAVGHGYLMANAPEPLLRRLPLHTLDHITTTAYTRPCARPGWLNKGSLPHHAALPFF